MYHSSSTRLEQSPYLQLTEYRKPSIEYIFYVLKCNSKHFKMPGFTIECYAARPGASKFLPSHHPSMYVSTYLTKPNSSTKPTHPSTSLRRS